MAIEIQILNDGQYINGKPIPVYRIVIDGISIRLPKDKFEELTDKLGNQINEDYQKLLKVDEKYSLKLDRMKNLRNNILELLYGESYRDDGWLMRKEFDEMDEKILDKIIEDYGNDLGLE